MPEHPPSRPSQAPEATHAPTQAIPTPSIRRASGGLRFLGTLLLLTTLGLLSCQSLFVL